MAKRKNFALTEEQLADAREAITLGEGSGMTMAQAMRIALRLEAGPRAVGATFIKAAIEAFCADCVRRKRRHKTVSGYRQQLELFERAHKGQDMESLTRAGLQAYLQGLPLATPSIEVRFRCIRALFRWARRRNPPLCNSDPTLGLTLDLPRQVRKIKCFSPESTAAIMARLAPNWRPAGALAFFAGIRPQELAGFGKARLNWDSLDFAGRIIRIPGEVAKTTHPRILEGLPETVWKWLELTPEEERKGSICTLTHQGFVDAMWRAGIAHSKDFRWIQDGPRHSFASYALALNSNPGLVSIWLGHEGDTRLLHQKYRALKTKAEAEAYFAISPETKASSSQAGIHIESAFPAAILSTPRELHRQSSVA